MATVKFDELALQYVLSDDPEQAKSVAEKAASAIEGTANNRVLIGKWVSSINRWMPSSSAGDFDDGEGQDDDFISRAKGACLMIHHSKKAVGADTCIQPWSFWPAHSQLSKGRP